MDWGGWMWFVIDVLAVAVLGGAIIYGTSMWRHRSRDPEVERRSDEATRDLYHHPRIGQSHVDLHGTAKASLRSSAKGPERAASIAVIA